MEKVEVDKKKPVRQGYPWLIRALTLILSILIKTG